MVSSRIPSMIERSPRAPVLRSMALRAMALSASLSFGVGMPSRDFTSEDLFSSPMMSMHNSTHSSQMKTVGPAMSLRTSCWFLPQNEQRSGFLVSPPLTLLISETRQDTSHHSRSPAGQTRLTHDREGQPRAGTKGGGAPRLINHGGSF